jgi:hypothetical protein
LTPTASPIAREVVDDFADLGITAFTTTRAAGSFGLHGDEGAGSVMGRWYALVDELHAAGGPRFATARQVHGTGRRSPSMGPHGRAGCACRAPTAICPSRGARRWR